MVSPDRQSPSTSKANIGLIVGLVIGFIAIICVCTIGFIIVSRRITKGRQRSCMSNDTERTPATHDDENIELLSQEASRNTETGEFPSAEKLTVLQEHFRAIKEKYCNIKKITNPGNKVTIEGVLKDIENAFKELGIKCSEIKRTEYYHSKSTEWWQFCEKRQTVEYIHHKLKQKKLLGTWIINDEELIVLVFGDGSSENFKNTLMESVIAIEHVDKTLLSSEFWGEFLLDIRRKFKEKVDIFTKDQQDVVIICTDDVVKQVTQMTSEFSEGITDTTYLEAGVGEFVLKYWTQDDFDDIRNNGVMVKTKVTEFKLRGLLNNVTKGKQELNKKLDGISSKQHFLKRTGLGTVLVAFKHSGTISDIETECRCVLKLPQEIDESSSMVLCDHEVIDSDILENRDLNTSTSPKCFQTRRHKIKVQLIQGDICNQTADIIVGAASNHELGSNTAFISLFKQGGSRLQTDYNRLYPNGIQDGEVAVIDSGDFNSDKCYLTSLPPWREARSNGCKVLRNFIRECLRLADLNDKSTIAFSSMVTGVYLGYQTDMAASIMYGAVVEFDTSYNKTSLKEINIVTDEEEDLTTKIFEDHHHKRIYGASSVGSLSTDFVGGRIKIELVTGDLSTQKVDAIHCSLSEDKNLNNNVIFKSLVKSGNKSLQDECEKKCLKLEVGKTVDIPGGTLPCKTIFLNVLSTYVDNISMEQNLITSLQAVFDHANSKSYKSLAIAAIENGYLNYPAKTAANCMYDAVIEWASKKQDASLKIVRIVMYGRDTETQQTYRMCHSKAKGRETRTNRIFFEDGTNLIKQEENCNYRMVKNGCAIGPITLQIQVGDVSSYTADAIVGAISGKEEKSTKEGEIIKTGNDELETRIHLQYQVSLADWRGNLVHCLEEADRKFIKSLALHVPKSGVEPKRFPADGIGNCLFAAIDDFTGENPKSNVTDVRLVVPDSDGGCIPAIIAALQARTTAVNLQWGVGKLLKSQLGVLAEFNKLTECSVTVFSDATTNQDRCIKALNDRIGLEFAKKVVDVDKNVINSGKAKQICNILESDIVVDVMFDKAAGKFTINGPLRNVIAALKCLHNKQQQYKNKEKNLKSAEVLYDQTKWHWLSEKKMASLEEVPYDRTINYIIETAYKAGSRTVELQSKDGTLYEIDFQKLVEYPKVNMYDTVLVIRKNILKTKGAKKKWPKAWTSMSEDENVTRVKLDCDEYYQGVEKRFLAEIMKGVKENSRSVQVARIERIQNKTLYKQYKTKKKGMKQKNHGCTQTERLLWYETAEEHVLWIINNGFNRRYCGVNEAVYGQGVYFAADASYSAQTFLSGNKPGAKRYMFLAKVLTGKLIQGNPSMRVHPLVDPEHPKVIYDSAVDDVKNPTQFVIFHDKQAYPKYLIIYTT